MRRPGCAVVPEPAGADGSRRRGGQPDRGVRTLFDGAQRRPDDGVEGRDRPGDAGRGGPARVQRVHGDPGPGQLACPQPGEHDLHPLGPGVRGRAAVVAVDELHVVDLQRLGVHATGGHEQHPRVGPRPGRPGLERVRQQAGEQVRAEHVHGQRHLVAVGGLRALRRQQPALCTSTSSSGTRAVNSRANRRTSASSPTRRSRRRATPPAPAPRSGTGTARPSPRCARAGAPAHRGGQPGGRRLPESGAGAGDQGDPPGECAGSRVRLVAGPGSATRQVAEFRVTGGDRAVEQGVQSGQHLPIRPQARPDRAFVGPRRARRRALGPPLSPPPPPSGARRGCAPCPPATRRGGRRRSAPPCPATARSRP